jgi:tetratricopeptide (TPR) repeat protein
MINNSTPFILNFFCNMMIKKIYFHILFIIFCYAVSPHFSTAQTINDTLKTLYSQKKYDEAINRLKGKKEDQLTPDGLFYAGMCYYGKSDDQKALYCFNKAIEKNPNNPSYYYYRSFTLLYLKKYEEALKNFTRAIKDKPDDPALYKGKAEAFLKMHQPDSAVAIYQKAVALKNCPPDVYLKIAQTHQESNQREKALAAYYTAKTKLDKKSQDYLSCLYNVGVLEYELNAQPKAEAALKELLQLNPKDYISMAKLIQVYYAQKTYQKADTLKKTLYKAFEAKTLPQEMEAMFCFDQFDYKGKKVLVFERFENEDFGTYYKHLFYLTDNKGKILLSVHTEHSFAVAAENKKYVLGKTEGHHHYTYWGFLFDELFDYTKMKEGVLAILEGKVKPSFSSSVEKKH